MPAGGIGVCGEYLVSLTDNWLCSTMYNVQCKAYSNCTSQFSRQAALSAMLSEISHVLTDKPSHPIKCESYVFDDTLMMVFFCAGPPLRFGNTGSVCRKERRGVPLSAARLCATSGRGSGRRRPEGGGQVQASHQRNGDRVWPLDWPLFRIRRYVLVSTSYLD